MMFERLELRRLFALAPAGAEFPINSTTVGDQFAPAIASDRNGNSVAVWTSANQDGSGYGIVARRYNDAGTPLGGEFLVNTITAGNQTQPSVARSPSGAIVIAWTSNSPTTGDDVYVRRFSPTGTALDPVEVLVNSAYTANTQESPDVAMDASGNFAVVWNSDGQDGSDYGVYARTYHTGGAPLTSAFLVNQYTTDLQADPSVAMDRTGKFVVAWNSGNLGAGQAGDAFYGIYARRFSILGTPLSNEFHVNTYTADYQTFPDAAVDADGDFVIAWQSFGQHDPGSTSIIARRYSSAGTAVSGEMLVNSVVTGANINPSVSINARGDFTIAWQRPDASSNGVYIQSFDYMGFGVGGQMAVNTQTTNDQSRPAIALDANGNAFVAWQSNAQDGSGYGVFAQRYTAPDQLAPTVQSAAFNFLTGHSVTIVFREDVGASLSLADITVQMLTPTPGVISPGSMTLNYIGNTAEITFVPGYANGILPDGNYRVTLNSNDIFDGVGYALDGDDNGQPGGSYTFDSFVLAGDANRDRTVNAADLGIVSANWQGFPRSFAQGDFNYDQRVDINDISILAVQYKKTLPAPPPPPALAISTTLPFATPRRTPTRVATTILS